MPAYRNAVQSTHHDVESGVREANAPLLLEGVLAMSERAPPIGGCVLVVVSKLTRDERGHHAELALMHGGGPVLESATFDREVWDTLERGRVYLHRAPALFVPLSPFAAAESSPDGWTLGWLEGRVHVPTFQYDAGLAGSFRARADEGEVRELLAADEGEAQPVVASTLEPWRGLLAYDEEHAPVYFGREEETEEALARLRRDGALVIAGASGSGKSSLMLAGVLPRLRASFEEQGVRARMARFRPGAEPLRALREALLAIEVGDGSRTIAWSRDVSQLLGDKPDPDALVHLARGARADGERLVLAVDQLEEARTIASAAEREAFLAMIVALAGAASSVDAVVIATVRADLLGEMFEHEGLRALVERRIYPLGPMPKQRLLRVISEPLRGRRVAIEPGLADAILHDVGADVGTLALVSQVLSTLWDERGRYGDKLTRAGYEAAGRVEGALERQASAAYAASPQPALVDRVLLQLAHRSEDGRFTRRRVAIAEIATALRVPSEKLRVVIAPFVERRLFVAGHDSEERTPTLEVAHEALFTAWRHLDTLLRDETEVLTLRQELRVAARGGELWTDASTRLRRSEELIALGRMDVTDSERAFLTESRGRVRGRKVLERGVAVALFVLALAAIVVWRQGVSARARSERSEQAQLALDAVRTANVRGYEYQGLVKALTAADRARRAGGELPKEIAGALIEVVNIVDGVPWRGHAAEVTSVAFSNDGGVVVTGSRDRTAKVWDTSDGGLLATLIGHGAPVNAVAISRDGRRVLTASKDTTVRIWPTLGDVPLRELRCSSYVRTATFAGDNFAVSGEETGEVRRWDLTTGEGRVLTKHGGRVRTVEASADGSMVVTASEDTHVRVIRVADGVVLRDQPHLEAVYAARFSPDGALVLTNSADKIPRIFTAAGNDLPRELPKGNSQVEAVAWSLDGALAASADHDGYLRIFDAKTGALAKDAHAHQGAAFAIEFAADGRVITAGEDRLVRVTPRDDATPPTLLRGHDGTIVTLAVHPDRGLAVSGGYDPTPLLWRLDTGSLIAPLAGEPKPKSAELAARLGAPTRKPPTGLHRIVAHESSVQAVAYSPDGTRVVSGSGDGTVRLWDLTTGALITTRAIGAPVTSVVFAETSARVAIVASDGALRVWSPADDSLVELGRQSAALRAVAWHGTHIAVVGDAGALAIYPDQPGAPRMLGKPVPNGCRALSLTNDARRVAVGCLDGDLRLYDVATGAQLGGNVNAHAAWVFGLAFSPDGTRLLSSGNDAILNLYSVPQLQELKSIKQVDWVHSVAWSNDSKLVVTASADRHARILDAQTLAESAVFTTSGRATAATFAPDRRSIAVGGDDGMLHVFASDPREYVRIGCHLLEGLREATEIAELCR